MLTLMWGETSLYPSLSKAMVEVIKPLKPLMRTPDGNIGEERGFYNNLLFRTSQNPTENDDSLWREHLFMYLLY